MRGGEQTIAPEAAVRCAPWTREQRVDPIGTAGCYAGYLLVEWPLPWPRDIAVLPGAAELAAAASRAGLRLQALVGEPGAERAHVITYRRARAGAGFTRHEQLVRPDRVVEAGLALVADPGPAARDAIVGDALVCTHGSRDRCCGSLGTSLALELAALDGRWPSGIRLWRTSHSGGHRFAPTATVLPEGTAWAYLDADALVRILRREGPLDDLLPRYRGCAALGSPGEQVLERAVLAEIGWPLLRAGRAGRADADGHVELAVELDDGSRPTFSGTVGVARMMPVPACGSPIDAAEKSEPELALSGFARIS